MIGKSGKYYRAGYLARQAGDWPDGEQAANQQQSTGAVKYDGSNNPNQSVTVTAPRDMPMALYDSQLSRRTISPAAKMSGLVMPASSWEGKNASPDSAYPGVSGRPTIGG